MAPTVLRYLDLAVPEDMEGRAITEPFGDLPAQKSRPPLSGDSGDRAGDVYDEDEAREMEERLRGLGYL